MLIKNKIILLIMVLYSFGSCIQYDSKSKVNNSSDIEEEMVKYDSINVKQYDSLQLSETKAMSIVKEPAKCEWCNIGNLKKLRLSPEIPKEDDLLNYLRCCNEMCHKNIEYSQASNYLLFIFFQKYSKMMISLMRKNEKIIDINYVNFMLQNPVEESVNIDTTSAALEQLEEKDLILEGLMASLKTAKGKLNNYKK